MTHIPPIRSSDQVSPFDYERLHPLEHAANKKVGAVFAYVAAAIATTFATSLICAYTPICAVVFTAASASPLIAVIAIVAISVGLVMAIRSTPKENIDTKRILFATFAIFQGVILSPLALAAATTFIVAGAAATALTAGLAFVALKTDIDFHKYTPILMVALGIIGICSLGSLFFPAVIAAACAEVSLWGGLALFSALILFKTQDARNDALAHPEQFDEINHAAGIYLDMLNIAIRLFTIMNRQQNNRQLQAQ